MKKRLVMLLAGLLTVLSMGFGLAQFSDVPAGHWAKEAVEALAAKGILVGFPDGTYRGNETLTRYQAALIIYRLLQQIEEELKAKGESPTMQAMSSEDIEALKNAVQELAAELAALGVRVSALEDSAATKEDIARLEAMIQELKAQPAPEPGMDAAALQDLADRVEAASIAADTALAQAQQLAEQLDALAQDVEGVKGDLASLQTQVEANAQAIQALNELAVLLNQDVLSLQDRVTALEKGLADLQGIDFEQFASKEDVAAVQEFAAALRSDLVSLSEKVSKLEGQVAELNKVRYTISGSLSATYGSIGLLPGSTAGDFDVDRLFPGNKFSSGPSGPAFRGNEYNFADTTQTFTGGGISLTLGVKLAQPGQTGVNLSEASVDLSATAFTGATTVSVDGATLKGNVDGQGFSVVYSNGASKFKFNDYLFANANDPDGVVTRQGVVATFSGSKLPLTPEVTVVVGNASSVAPNNVLNGDYFGVRLALKPLKDTTLALSYAENPGNRAAVALDFSTKKLLDLLDLDGAYVVSKNWGVAGTIFDNWGTANVDEAFFVRGTLTMGPVTLRANYRAIDPQYLNGFAGMSADHTAFYSGEIIGFYPAPFGSNTRGYGAEASVNLGFATLGGYYDRYSDYPQTPGTEKEAFGANARVPLPAGFSLTGFYSYASVAGVQATFAGADPAFNQGTPYFQFYAYPRDRYVSGFGAALSHDGRAKEALISNLNLTARYQQYYNDVTGNYDYRDIVAFADYSLTLGPLTLKPGLFFRSYTNDNAGAAVPAGTSPSRPGAFTENPSFTTFKWGIQITTQPLDVPFKPSLEGYFATRTTDFDGTTSDAQETYYRVGLKLNEFLASGSTFSVGYAYWEGQNHLGSPAVGSAYNPFTFTRDRIFRNPDVSAAGAPWAVSLGNNSGNVSGVYLEWNYYTFSVAAGWFDFNNTGAGTSSSAIGFKVSYEVKF
ncbi:S-layer protein [Thermus scotoductus]|uniref:S-layer protein n=1 Tax=Thermus scotoductus TaxID=37636 RepID=A0A430UYB9_THESC|nr:S-layer homology domain-containing protein [Thermus scotoductus]RTH98037.1 S-layer protein [Thermus scotoductus]RTI14470.1 S-layer protein [Thermus scotoductus]